MILQINRGEPRDGHTTGGHVPTAMSNVKSESVCDLVTTRFVNPDDSGFVSLIGDRSLRPHLRPVENVQSKKAAFCLQQVPSFHRSLRPNPRRVLNHRETRLLAPH